MEGKKILQFDLLGAFVCKVIEDGQVRNSVIPDKAGKKMLSFLQYLVENQGRNKSS